MSNIEKQNGKLFRTTSKKTKSEIKAAEDFIESVRNSLKEQQIKSK
jgi:hypothetical protein